MLGLTAQIKTYSATV